MLYSFHQNNQEMSVNFDKIDSNIPTKNSAVQSSSSTVASSSSLSSPDSPSKKLYSVCKLIAFPSNNSVSSSSLSVNGSDYNMKHHQLNDQREYLDYGKIKHFTVSTPSSLKSSLSTSSCSLDSMVERKSLVNNYSTINDNMMNNNYNKLDPEWCSARKRQLDEILMKLQQLHKVNLDDRENIEGMKKKTIKLIATYSNITMKANNFLTLWDRKYGFKLNEAKSLPPRSPSASSSYSSSPFDEKFEPNYLFNSTPIW